jgi:Rieske Fe-S protein
MQPETPSEAMLPVLTNAGCDSCVSRRDFLERVALVAGALIVAGCGGPDELTAVGSGALPDGPIVVQLADYPGLAGIGQPVEVHSTTGALPGIAAVRTGASSFIALGMSCTHQGTKVNISGQIFICPNHGARYSDTGAVTLGPATSALASRTVVYDAAALTLTIS